MDSEDIGAAFVSLLVTLCLGVAWAFIAAIPVMLLSWALAEYVFSPEVFRALTYWPAYWVALAIIWLKALT